MTNPPSRRPAARPAKKPKPAPLSELAEALLRDFGERYKSARIDAGLTQSVAATFETPRGQGQSYISKVERGQINLRVGTMIRLAETVGVDVFQLFRPPEHTARRK